MANVFVVYNIAYTIDKLVYTSGTSFTGHGWQSPPRARWSIALIEDIM